MGANSGILWSISLCIKFSNFDTFGIIRKIDIFGVMNIFCGLFFGFDTKIDYRVILSTEWDFFGVR